MWVEAVDPSSGRSYYTNSETGETSWVKPVEEFTTSSSPSSFWVEKLDPSTNRTFYANTETGETSWTQPEEMNKSNTTPAAEEEQSSNTVADTVEERQDPATGRVYYVDTTTGATSWTDPRTRVETEEEETQKQEATANTTISTSTTMKAAATEESISDWVETQDPASGRTFYRHKVTGEASWTNPSDAETTTETMTELKTESKAESKAEVTATNDASSTSLNGQGGASEWIVGTDPKTGREYYQNTTTGAAQWEQPEALANSNTTKEELQQPQQPQQPRQAQQAQWEERIDPTSGRTYFVNTLTNETSWERPLEIQAIEAEGDISLSTDTSSIIESPTEASRLRSIQINKSGDWIQMEDSLENRNFFYNERTNELTYVQPDTWSTEDEGGGVGTAGEGGGGTAGGTAAATTTATEPTPGPSEAMRRRSVVQLEEGQWSLRLDPETKREFYYNSQSGLSQWERPITFPKTAQRNKIIKKNKKDEVDMGTRRRSIVIEDSGGDWVRMEDKTTRQTFYYNHSTEKTQWERPTSYDGGERSSKETLVTVIGWVTKQDPTTGRDYYFHEGTGESTWERPVEMDSSSSPSVGGVVTDRVRRRSVIVQRDETSSWTKMKDPNSNVEFWYNSVTGVSQWDIPAGITTNDSNDSTADSVTDSATDLTADSVTPIDENMRRRSLVVEISSNNSNWTQMKDPESGRIFYHNTATGQSSWEKPAEHDNHEMLDGHAGSHRANPFTGASTETKDDAKEEQGNGEAATEATEGTEGEMIKTTTTLPTNNSISVKEVGDTSGDSTSISNGGSDTVVSDAANAQEKKIALASGGGGGGGGGVVVVKKRSKMSALRARRKRQKEEAEKKKKIDAEKKKKTEEEKKEQEMKEKEAAANKTEEEEMNPLLAMLARNQEESLTTKKNSSSSSSTLPSTPSTPATSSTFEDGWDSPNDWGDLNVSSSSLDDSKMSSMSFSPGSPLKGGDSRDGRNGGDTKKQTDSSGINTSLEGGSEQRRNRNLITTRNTKNTKKKSSLPLCASSSFSQQRTAEIQTLGATHPSFAMLEETRKSIDDAANTTHVLLRETLWAEWCEMRNIESPTSAAAANNTSLNESLSLSQVSSHARVEQTKALTTYGRLISNITDYPDVLVAVGCVLPMKAQQDFAAFLVDRLYCEFSCEEMPLLNLLDAAIQRFHKAHQLNLYSLSKEQRSESSDRRQNQQQQQRRRPQNMLGYLLARFMARTDIQEYVTTLMDVSSSHLLDSLSADQNRDRDHRDHHQRGGGGRTNHNHNNNNNNNNKKRQQEKTSRAVGRLCEMMLTEWSLKEMPDGLRFVLQALCKSSGPFTPAEILIEHLLIPAVEQWNEWNQVPTTRGGSREGSSVLSMLEDMLNVRFMHMTPREEERCNQPLRRLEQLADVVSSEKEIKLSNVGAYNLKSGGDLHLSRRVVTSCFDLYLLHMGLVRYNTTSAWPKLPGDTKRTLQKMGDPRPLPGTDQCGSKENPFFLLRLRAPPNPFSRDESSWKEQEEELDEEVMRGEGEGGSDTMNDIEKLRKLKIRRQQYENLQDQLARTKKHLELMNQITTAREQNLASPSRRRASSPSNRRASPSRIISPERSTPTREELRISRAGPPRSALHALMQGRFSPLRLNNNRSTML